MTAFIRSGEWRIHIRKARRVEHFPLLRSNKFDINKREYIGEDGHELEQEIYEGSTLWKLDNKNRFQWCMDPINLISAPEIAKVCIFNFYFLNTEW